MKAWQIQHLSDLAVEDSPLRLTRVPKPIPGTQDLLIKVSCCGICHTELDEIEGRTPPSQFPVIPGHQVVGQVIETGPATTRFKVGDRVGVAWIFSACGVCDFCKAGKENLCSSFKGTGRDADGGYAEYVVVNENFACRIPSDISDTDAAPLLCAGAVGYRSLRLTLLEDGQVLGFAGFGASGHLVLKTAKLLFPHSKMLVWTRNQEEQKLAKMLGADWAGNFQDHPPYRAHAIIDTTPAWMPVVSALSNLHPGGRLIINAIRKEDRDQDELSKLDYPRHLWMEKEIKSVANITVKDAEDFLALASRLSIRPHSILYPFDEANRALVELKRGNTGGAKVLLVGKVD